MATTSFDARTNRPQWLVEALAWLEAGEPRLLSVWHQAVSSQPKPVSSPMRIAGVVPVHNRCAHTLACLASLVASVPDGVELRIFVVDDGSTDGTTEALSRALPAVQIVRGNGTLFYSGGINVGLETALVWEPEFVLFFNNDQIFDGELLTHSLSTALERRAVVGALLLRWDQPEEVFQVGQFWETWYGGFRHFRGLTPRDFPGVPIGVRALSGNCVLAPVAAVRAAGYMDARHLPMFGDTEYFERMRKAGWELVVEPRAKVWCEPNRVHTTRGQSLSVMLRQFFIDRNHYNNLWHNARRICYSAPNRRLGLAAAFIYFGRLALKCVGLGGTWPAWRNPPLYWSTTPPPT
jgi:GT2 family glycosyltransferase